MSENHMNDSGMAGSSGEVCLDVQDLKMHFKLKSGLFSKPKILKAVDGVSFSIGKGETMGPGGRVRTAERPRWGALSCGSTRPQTERSSSRARTSPILRTQQMLPYRKKMQMIFQDPYTSLDPRKEYRRYYRGTHVGA